MLQIETQRLLLRSFDEADAEAASHLSKQPIVAHFMSDMVLVSKEAAEKWIRWLKTKCNNEEPCQLLAIELKENNRLIGYVGAAPKQELNGEIEVLFAVSDEQQNKGYATEAAKAMIGWAMEEAGQTALSAIVKPENKSSRRVIEKLGFTYCDTRVLPYDGEDCVFDYFRLYHTEPKLKG